MSKITAQKKGDSKQDNKEADRKSKIEITAMKLKGFPNAAITLATLDKTLDAGTVLDSLNASIENIADGEITEIESMLITQAKVLEYVFYDNIKKLYSSEIEHAEIYGNMALRAQNQSRKTLLALAELKNPRRTMFIKQQNNAINQQINNSEKTNSEKIEKVANELLRGASHETMDFRGTPETISIDKEMGTLENSRCQNTGGQDYQSNECL